MIFSKAFRVYLGICKSDFFIMVFYKSTMIANGTKQITLFTLNTNTLLLDVAGLMHTVCMPSLHHCLIMWVVICGP